MPRLVAHSAGCWAAYDDEGHELGEVFRLDGPRATGTARADNGAAPRYTLLRRSDALSWLVNQHRAPRTPPAPPADVVLSAVAAQARAGHPEVAAQLATGAILQLADATLRLRGSTAVPNVWLVLERIDSWVRAVSEVPAEVQRQTDPVVDDDEPDRPPTQLPRRLSASS